MVWLSVQRPKRRNEWLRAFGLVLVAMWSAPFASIGAGIAEPSGKPAIPSTVPGVVIDHSPASAGLYIGSPSLVLLTNGDYLASHDFFGPNSKEFECPRTVVFRSSNAGISWEQVAQIQPLFWANLFVHRGAVYILGTDKHHGRIVLRRSLDNGGSWTEPRDSGSGLLTATGEYHTAPVPVIEHDGRLWRAFENAEGGTRWGERYRAGVLSVPIGKDLLQATNWTFSNFLPGNSNWLKPRFGGWLEGNVVVGPDDRVVNVLRVDTPVLPEKAAIVELSSDGRRASFDPAQGFISFPGGAKKFTIRHDPRAAGYWTLASIAQGPDALPKQGLDDSQTPASIRNTLALLYSSDLSHWVIRRILLHHPDSARHAFQYVDWQFERNDLIAVCRTAYEDGEGGAHNGHDANFLTFHRFPGFRSLAGATRIPPETR